MCFAFRLPFVVVEGFTDDNAEVGLTALVEDLVVLVVEEEADFFVGLAFGLLEPANSKGGARRGVDDGGSMMMSSFFFDGLLTTAEVACNALFAMVFSSLLEVVVILLVVVVVLIDEKLSS